MLSKTKIALSLAIVLGTASAGLAATKHPVRHRPTSVERQMPAGNPVFGGSAYGYSPSGYAAPHRVPEPNSGAGIGTNFLSSGEGTIAN